MNLEKFVSARYVIINSVCLESITFLHSTDGGRSHHHHHLPISIFSHPSLVLSLTCLTLFFFMPPISVLRNLHASIVYIYYFWSVLEEEEAAVISISEFVVILRIYISREL